MPTRELIYYVTDTKTGQNVYQAYSRAECLKEKQTLNKREGEKRYAIKPSWRSHIEVE